MSPAIEAGLARLEALCNELEVRVSMLEQESEVVLDTVYGEIATASTDNTLMGHAIAAKGATVSTVRVKQGR